MTALLNWRLWAAAGVAVLLVWTHWQAYRQGGASARVELAELRASYAEAGRHAEKAERARERTWADRIEEVSTNAEAEKNALAADLAASRAAADGLRSAAASAARRACPSAPAAGSGQAQPSADPLDLLVDVLGRADARAGELAEYADRLRIAGEACEASYDALTK
ncbi:DUF2514 family protein [Xenophilus sp.]|uniref:DUF2514 family protein n=1 Tax=Xenophilus sp. TaxID=1873499 RepID=UPI0037DC8677